MPCLELLTQLHERQHELDRLDIHLVGVAIREGYQAQKLIDDGIGVDLFLDPNDEVRQALGAAGRIELWRLLNPFAARAYVKAARQSERSDPIWAETRRRPGILLLDSDLTLRWSRMGTRLGDYPTADEVLIAVQTALST